MIRPAPTLTALQAARDIPARSPCGWMQKRAAGSGPGRGADRACPPCGPACHGGADQLPLCRTSSGKPWHRQGQRRAAGSGRFQPSAGRCGPRLFLPCGCTAGHADEPAGRNGSGPCEHREPRRAGTHSAGLRRRTFRMADRGQDRGGKGEFSHRNDPAAGRHRGQRHAPGGTPQKQEPFPPHLSGAAHCSEP